jgi:hypothetical protein
LEACCWQQRVANIEKESGDRHARERISIVGCRLLVSSPICCGVD